jgi:L-threonylcarbamoyladenylate synthase
MAEIGIDIERAKAILESGNLVGIPTETVYGLAANAFNDASVAKIFEAKNRPFFDPLILHTDSIEKVKSFVEFIPPSLDLLLKTFSPGPLTVLLPKNNKVSDLCTAGLPRVAVRIPNHQLALELLKSIDFPLAAPSANPFGYISPTSAEHVNKQLGNKIEYILDGGECKVGLESTIIGLEGDAVTVYRKGGLAIEVIEKLVGEVKLLEHSSSNPTAPGMLKSHYAPNKKVFLWKGQNLDKRSGFLSFSEGRPHIHKNIQFVLSPKGNLTEAAQNLFKGLRYLVVP